jgi:hypothetical protein
MLVACLWSPLNEPDLLSCAAVADDPPSEVGVAGYDRYIIPIKPNYIDAWSNPNPKDRSAPYSIGDNRGAVLRALAGSVAYVHTIGVAFIDGKPLPV